MRLKGTLTEWNDDRGFGFIEPTEGGTRVFCHIKAFDVRVRRPMVGDGVTYEAVKGEDGRMRAEHVRPVGLEDASDQSNIKPQAAGDHVVMGSRKSWKSGLVTAIILAVVGFYAYQHSASYRTGSSHDFTVETSDSGHGSDSIAQAFNQHRSNIQVQGSGVVDRILSDDTQGLRHQRFIVRLASGHRVLIAHNIDLASRVEPLAEGDRVEFYGEYEWNDKGGVVHWTHRDPQGHHQTGWIKHGGSTYQ